jgi:hypothetical protein
MKYHHTPRVPLALASLASLASLLALLGLSACATLEPEGPPAKEFAWALTHDHQLIRFNSGQPRRILERQPVTGLKAGESLLGIDYRVSRGVLFALSSQGRLLTLDTATGAATQVGSPGGPWPLKGQAYGFDFNPAVDRIRVVSESGLNMRLHPETGAQVDSDPNTSGVQADPNLAYAAGDAHAGKAPQVVAAAYTYNTRDEKITTNYAIDRALGTLVTQGTLEGRQPAVSPNTGQLFTVGSLGLGPLSDVSFDISDVDNTALVSAVQVGQRATRLYRLDLSTGKATLLGTVGSGQALRGLAIEP